MNFNFTALTRALNGFASKELFWRTEHEYNETLTVEYTREKYLFNIVMLTAWAARRVKRGPTTTMQRSYQRINNAVCLHTIKLELCRVKSFPEFQVSDLDPPMILSFVASIEKFKESSPTFLITGRCNEPSKLRSVGERCRSRIKARAKGSLGNVSVMGLFSIRLIRSN